MGNGESKERQLFIDIIKHLLMKRGIKVAKSTLSSFFSFVQEQCPWLPEEGSVGMDTWHKVGETLKQYYSHHDPEDIPAETFSLWNLIRDELDPTLEVECVPSKKDNLDSKQEGYQELREMMAAACLNDDDQLSPQEVDLTEAAARYHDKEGDWTFSVAKPQPKPCTLKNSLNPEVSKSSPRPPRPLRLPPARPYAGNGAPYPHRRLKDADEDRTISACSPIVFDEFEDEPVWEPLPTKLLKELKQACSMYGPQAPYTQILLDALAARWMTPYDWAAVAKACLTRRQYLLWRTEYEDLAKEQSAANKRHGIKTITYDMLTGSGKYDSARDQMRLDKQALEQATGCALNAWKGLPQGLDHTSLLAGIKQRSEEPYEDFVSRLLLSVRRVITNQEAADILIRQLAFENANSICQAILRPIRKSGTLTDYIRACADVSPAIMQGIAIAVALKVQAFPQVVQNMLRPLNGGTRHTGGVCFSCGKSGHFSRNCPQKSVGERMTPPNSASSETVLPKALCYHFQKGFHWAKDCKSKLHKDGTPLAPSRGNPIQNQGNVLQGHPQALTIIGATSFNLFILFVPSQSSAKQPQGMQDWTSVPPLQQY